MNTIVLMGAEIGDNVIIGAGSVVTGNIPNNVVAVGAPARVICSLEDYYNKRKGKMKEEALQFFPLYAQRSKDYLIENSIKTDYSGDEETEIIEAFLATEPVYVDYKDFLKDVAAADNADIIDGRD